MTSVYRVSNLMGNEWDICMFCAYMHFLEAIFDTFVKPVVLIRNQFNDFERGETRELFKVEYI